MSLRHFDTIQILIYKHTDIFDIESTKENNTQTIVVKRCIEKLQQ
jgi:hypothetical protein